MPCASQHPLTHQCIELALEPRCLGIVLLPNSRLQLLLQLAPPRPNFGAVLRTVRWQRLLLLLLLRLRLRRLLLLRLLRVGCGGNGGARPAPCVAAPPRCCQLLPLLLRVLCQTAASRAAGGKPQRPPQMRHASVRLKVGAAQLARGASAK